MKLILQNLSIKITGNNMETVQSGLMLAGSYVTHIKIKVVTPVSRLVCSSSYPSACKTLCIKQYGGLHSQIATLSLIAPTALHKLTTEVAKKPINFFIYLLGKYSVRLISSRKHAMFCV